ncbi:hypothetical protein [Pedobacter sp. UBA5917]|jgi:hypothetical protein|uniref:hypothetical protein n=1 Tax=Pedobacter sp. UBA5917 TaxID=1947061 RepID=UPI0025E2643E|nr:hypothetical protein [Pedobacter sp. UBA5917]
MTEIESILNADFLLKLVAIETIQHYSTIDTSIKNEGMESKVELKVMVLEPAENNQGVDENIYELVLGNVTSYQMDFNNVNERTFEFDTDEVKLERNTGNAYLLRFFNSSVNINIVFSELSIKQLN